MHGTYALTECVTDIGWLETVHADSFRAVHAGETFGRGSTNYTLIHMLAQ